MKVQFSTINNQKYSLRTNPEIVELEPSYACEFEVLIVINCATTINEEIKIISLIYSSALEQDPVTISFTTELSSFIDPVEISIGKQIGNASLVL